MGVIMTHFEIIILTLIYLFCYGYTLASFIKEENTRLRIFLAFASLLFALYAPFFMGGAIYEKLNSKNS
jgi:hypothetical protein